MPVQVGNKKAAKKAKKAAKVRAKAGATRLTRVARKALAKKYLASQANSPVKAQIATEAADLQTKIDTLIKMEDEHDVLHAALVAKELEVVAAEGELETGMGTYVHKATTLAKDDATILTGLGVEAAAPRKAKEVGPGGVVTNVRLLMGVDSGTAQGRWTRPPGAASFQAQYKHDPVVPVPGVVYEWLPGDGGFATKNVDWLIEGLTPAEPLRLRVRAIGATAGPWSEEVLGRAR